MGGQSVILGYIKEPSAQSKKIVLIRDHNRSKIFSLRRMDEFPPLNSTFFSQTGELETFSNSLLYFAGSFKEIEANWEEWLEKFENLLTNVDLGKCLSKVGNLFRRIRIQMGSL